MEPYVRQNSRLKREKQMYITYILSLLNVVLIFGIALNHALRGLEGWWLIALLLFPAFGMMWSIDNLD